MDTKTNIPTIESNSKTKKSNEVFFKPTIQKKLTVGSSIDCYEKEADNVANRVMGMSEPSNQNLLQTGSLVQKKCSHCELEEKLQKKSLVENITPLIQRSSFESGGDTPNHVESQINNSKGGGSLMDTRTRNFMETRFGADFSEVKIHTGNQAVQMSRDLSAQAFTVGNDIYFNEGKYSPNSNSGKHLLAHELTHTVQQSGGIGRKIQKTDDFAMIRLWEISFLRNSASTTDFMLNGENRLFFNNNQDLNVLSISGEWMRVRGEAYYGTNISAGIQTGWVRRIWTNIAPSRTPSTENDRIAQDLDDFLDQYLIPALATWRVAIRTSGNAYLTAHTNYSDALRLADQQAQDRANFYAALLTVVGVGALGWLGETAQIGRSFSGLLKNPAVRGSLEDALQTGIGETIDIVQGGWFGSHINRETHPLRYLNGQLLQTDAIEGELSRSMGAAKSSIRRSSTAIDRADILIRLFTWWNGSRVKNMPNLRPSSEAAMARAFETGFWIKYINTVLTEDKYYLFYDAGYNYNTPENAVIARFRELGMMNLANIQEWDSYPYQGFGPDYEGDTPYFGSDSTSQIAIWARSYILPTFD